MFFETGNSMDIVTLKNKNQISGEIYQKDVDGSLYMLLPDGSKKYILAEEILSIENNSVPFELDTDKKAKRNKDKYHFSIYLGFQQHLPGKVNFDGLKSDIFNPYSGILLGGTFNLKITKGLFFEPGIELTYSFPKMKNEFIVNDITFYKNYCSYTTDQINLNVPIMIGYDFHLSKKLGISLMTGPVVNTISAYSGRDFNYFGDDYWISKPTGWVFNNSYFDFMNIQNESSNYEYARGSFNYYRVNMDWRIGFKLNIKNVLFGLTYSFGVTKRLGFGNYYEEKGHDGDLIYGIYKSKVSMREDCLQAIIGYSF